MRMPLRNQPKITTRPKAGAASTKTATKRSKSDKHAIPDAEARSGSKLQTCLALLKRRNGATLGDLTAATGWQPHSVRGFLSGTVKKKLGLSLSTAKDADGVRRYHLSGEARR